MIGDGLLNVQGGSNSPLLARSDSCDGGGGAGGRVAIHYEEHQFQGTTLSHGGRGYECGGSGLVLFYNVKNNTKRLKVDNRNTCTPKNPEVDWTRLTSTHRGQLSFHTWIFDEPGSHTHTFDVNSFYSYVLL